MHWLRIDALSGQIVETRSVALYLWIHGLTRTESILHHILGAALVKGHSLFSGGTALHLLLSSFERFHDLEFLFQSLVL